MKLTRRLLSLSFASSIVFATAWTRLARSVPAEPQPLSLQALMTIERLFPNQTILREHTFNVQLPQCGRCTFVPVSDVQSRPELSLHLVKDGQIHYTFPQSDADRTWASYSMLAVAFTDLDSDGQDDVAVLAQYITGIGPSGTQPFPAAAVYFSRDTVFKHDRQISQYLTQEGITTIAELIAAIESMSY